MGVPPLSMFFSTSKCATVELGKSLFFAKFFGQSACLARLVVPPCFFILEEAGAQSLVRHLPFLSFFTRNCATGVHASGRRKLCTAILVPKWFLEKLLKHQFQNFRDEKTFRDLF